MGRRKKNNGDDEDNGFAQWGGYMAAKRAKLMEQFNDQTSKEKISDIFKGVEILVNGYTKPNAEELRVLMAEHGGIFHMYQVPSTTHIIASNLPNVKINKLGSVPIVKPGWISDSITLGRLLDYSKYLLYTNQSKTQPKLNFNIVQKDILNVTTVIPKLSPNTFANGTNANEVSKFIPEAALGVKCEDAKKLSPEAPRPTKTASDPKFLSEFYNNSRLHLISTLGAEFKQLVNDMREKGDSKFPGLERISGKTALPCTESVIMHIDMDCFFVSVGLRARPDLRGKPVAVTHSKGGQVRGNVDRQVEISMYMERLPEGADCRLEAIDNTCSLSEIASCSYEARRCGIKNGMFMGAALKLCPELKAIPYDFQGYREVSNTLYRTLAEYTLDIEAVSCDEMFVDVTKILRSSGMGAMEWGAHIRAVITERTGCPCSAGFGGNRLQARLATRKAKPDGAYHLKASDVEAYMSDTPLADLPGVGRATLIKLKSLGLETCGDVQLASLLVLKKELGIKAGETIWEQARGVDKKPLKYEHERKSVSAEMNYGIRFKNDTEAVNFLESLSSEVKTRLQDVGMKAKCITLKLMVRAQDAPTETAKYLGHGVCDSLSRSSTVGIATDDPKVIFKEVRGLYEKLALPFEDLRGVGIQLSRLEKEAVMNNVLKNFLSKPPGSPKKVRPQIVKEFSPVIRQELVGSKDLSIKENRDPKTGDSSVSKNTSMGQKTGGRGRPKGSKNSKSAPAAKPRVPELSNFFKCTQKDRNNSKSQTAVSQVEQIDMTVLEHLPADIREEIIKEYNLGVYSSSQSTPNVQRMKPKPTCSGIPLARLESKKKPSHVPKANKGQKRNSFEALSGEDFKKMLTNWLDSGTKPLDVDVSMLGDHFRNMATGRKIEDLHVLTKFLHRNIEERHDCVWHDVYLKILNSVQEGMVMRYGGTLLVPRRFNCAKHC